MACLGLCNAQGELVIMCLPLAMLSWNCAQVLLLSAGVSFLLVFFDKDSQHEGLRAYVEPFVILLILFLNAAVGVWQESRSEAALEALKELQGEQAKVIREGKMVCFVCARARVRRIVRVHGICGCMLCACMCTRVQLHVVRVHV